MTLKNGAKRQEKPICCFKNDKNLVNFDLSTQKSQKFALWLSLLRKVYNVWPKKVERSYHSDIEESGKIWRKTDLWFRKWHEEFGKFLPEHLKVSKLRIWWDPFIQSRKWRMMQNLKSNWHVVSKLTLQFDEFWPEHSNVSKICTLMGSFWPNCIMFELKKYRTVVLWHCRLKQNLKEN